LLTVAGAAHVGGHKELLRAVPRRASRLTAGANTPTGTKTAQLYAAMQPTAICRDKRSRHAVRLLQNQHDRHKAIEMGNFHRFLADGAA
jgi:hypothetical protein